MTGRFSPLFKRVYKYKLLKFFLDRNDGRKAAMPATDKIISPIVIALTALIAAMATPTAVAETTVFPINSFGVAGPIPTPGNLGDLVGEPTPGTTVRFDPGDLGFLQFDADITGVVAGTPNMSLLFNIASAVPSASGATYVSVLLGNIAANGFGGLTFTQAATGGFTAPDGSAWIFEFTDVTSGGTGLFEINTDSFVDGCLSIGGCNTIVIGTSGLGAAGGSAFVDGGTLTFSSVVAASPEPGTWFLMIAGFMGLACRLKHLARIGGRGMQSADAFCPSVA